MVAFEIQQTHALADLGWGVPGARLPYGTHVMYLSDIKSSDHNHPAAIYNCPATSHRNDYFVWMEQLHLSMKLLSQI